MDETEQFVAWQGHKFAFEAREMTARDWKLAGASEEDLPAANTEWNAANNWRVPREEVPLSDVQLGAWMASNDFRLVD